MRHAYRTVHVKQQKILKFLDIEKLLNSYHFQKYEKWYQSVQREQWYKKNVDLEVSLLVPDVLERVGDYGDAHVHQVAARHLEDLLGELLPVLVDFL